MKSGPTRRAHARAVRPLPVLDWRRTHARRSFVDARKNWTSGFAVINGITFRGRKPDVCRWNFDDISHTVGDIGTSGLRELNFRYSIFPL